MVPPVEVEYHSIDSPTPGVADKSTSPFPHLFPGVTVGLTGGVLTIALISFFEERQPVKVFFASA